MKDPIVEGVRQHRQAHCREFGFDLGRICEDLRAVERASGREVMTLPSRKPPLARRRKET